MLCYILPLKVYVLMSYLFDLCICINVLICLNMITYMLPQTIVRVRLFHAYLGILTTETCGIIISHIGS